MSNEIRGYSRRAACPTGSTYDGEWNVTSTAATSELVYDPYDHDTIFNPHALFRRLRDEAPLFYSEQYDFYAISRFEDIERTLVNREAFISRKGVTLDILKSGMEIPPGHADLRGSADPRDPPCVALPDVHAEADRSTRAGDPGALRQAAGSPGGCGRVRLRRRRRFRDPDASDQHARGNPGSRTRKLCATTSRGSGRTTRPSKQVR